MMPEGRRTRRGTLPSAGILLGLALLVSVAPAAHAETASVSVGGQSYDIEYTGTGVTVSSAEAMPKTASVIFGVDVPDDAGTLDVTFERAFFDEACGGLDGEFIVLADGDFAVFEETRSNVQSRTLSIELPVGSSEVEVLGSTLAGTDLCNGAVEPEPPAEVPAPEPAPAPSPSPDPAPDPKQCGAGTVLVDGQCVLEKKCGAGTKLVDGQCVLDKTCGEGTVLVDGQCVLDKTCGEGTVLVDGQCVLEQSGAPFSLKSLGKDLGVGLFVAFAAAGVLGVILGIVAWAHRRN